MEALLNLLWLAISAALFTAWQLRWKRDREHPHPQSVTAVALICVAVLLFFPVSLTDDLHADLMLAGDVSAKRENPTVRARGAEHPVSHVAHGSGLAVIPESRITVATIFIANCIAASQFSLPPTERRSSKDRAPPLRA